MPLRSCLMLRHEVFTFHAEQMVWGHMEGQILMLHEVFQRRVLLPNLSPGARLAYMLTGLFVAEQPTRSLLLATFLASL